jgi:hypothetical protein
MDKTDSIYIIEDLVSAIDDPPCNVDKLHEDAYSKGAQVATENLSQDFPEGKTSHDKAGKSLGF